MNAYIREWHKLNTPAWYQDICLMILYVKLVHVASYIANVILSANVVKQT